jgi:hypothetical protein
MGILKMEGTQKQLDIVLVILHKQKNFNHRGFVDPHHMFYGIQTRYNTL